METALEKLRWERRRKLQVRQAFSAGLAHFRDEGGDPFPFYSACADYLAQGQFRLVAQDMRLAKLLKERVPADQTADHELIDALIGRLERGQQAAEQFAVALGDYRSAGATGQAAFVQAADDYLDVIVNVLGARSHSLRHLTTMLFSADDWAYIVDASPEFAATEARLFDRVRQAAGTGLDPESFSPQRPGSH